MHIAADSCRQIRNSAIRYNLECAAGYPLEDKQHFLRVSSKNKRFMIMIINYEWIKLSFCCKKIDVYTEIIRISIKTSRNRRRKSYDMRGFVGCSLYIIDLIMIRFNQLSSALILIKYQI